MAEVAMRSLLANKFSGEIATVTEIDASGNVIKTYSSPMATILGSGITLLASGQLVEWVTDNVAKDLTFGPIVQEFALEVGNMTVLISAVILIAMALTNGKEKDITKIIATHSLGLIVLNSLPIVVKGVVKFLG